MKAWANYPVIYEINTWVWLGDLSRKYQRPVNLATVPPPPSVLGRVPLFGGDLAAAWQKVAVEGLQDFMKKLAP